MSELLNASAYDLQRLLCRSHFSQLNSMALVINHLNLANGQTVTGYEFKKDTLSARSTLHKDRSLSST